MASETELLASPDEPFGGIILVPFDSVTVIHRELMVEVVITFTNCREGGEDMVAGTVLVVKGSISEPVSKRVNTECGLNNNN